MGRFNPEALRRGQALGSSRGEQACRLITLLILLLIMLGWFAYGLFEVISGPATGVFTYTSVKNLAAPGFVICASIPNASLRCKSVARDHSWTACDQLVQTHWNLTGKDFHELNQPNTTCWITVAAPYVTSPWSYYFDNAKNAKMVLQLTTPGNLPVRNGSRYPVFFSSFEPTSYFDHASLCPQNPNQCLDKTMSFINTQIPAATNPQPYAWEIPTKRQVSTMPQPNSTSLLYRLQFSWLVAPNFGNILFKRSERYTVSKRFKVFGYNKFSEWVMGSTRRVMVNQDLSTIEFSGTERPLRQYEFSSLKRDVDARQTVDQDHVWSNFQIYPVKNPLNTLRSASDAEIEGAGLPYQVEIYKESWPTTMLTLLAGLGGFSSLIIIVYNFLWGRTAHNPFGIMQKNIFKTAPLRDRYKKWWYRFWIPFNVSHIYSDDWVLPDSEKAQQVTALQINDRLRRLEDTLLYYLADVERLDGDRIPEVLRGRGGLNAIQYRGEESGRLLSE